METVTLARTDTAAVFSCRDFHWSFVPFFRSGLLTHQSEFDSKHHVRFTRLAFTSIGWVLGISNERISVVCI